MFVFFNFSQAPHFIGIFYNIYQLGRYNFKIKMPRNQWKSYSLPKTQPTRSCSKLPSFQQIQTCPQITPFKLNTSKLYFHHLDIDYGHLDCPLPPSVDKKIDTLKENKENIQGMQTTRFQFKNRTEEKKKPAKFFDQNQEDLQKTAKNTDRTNPQEKKQKKISLKLKQIYALEKKLRSAVTENQEEVVEGKDEPKSIQNTQEKKRKLNIQEMMVDAEQKQSSSKSKALSPIHKIHCNEIIQSLESVSTIQNSLSCFPKTETSLLPVPKINISHGSVSNSFRSSQKKVVHSRIIKTYVGGSKMQLKVINYPDSSDYLKLSSKKSKNKGQTKENRETNSFRF